MNQNVDNIISSVEYSPIKNSYTISNNKHTHNYNYYLNKIKTTIDPSIEPKNNSRYQRILLSSLDNYHSNDEESKKINEIQHYSYKKPYEDKIHSEKNKKVISKSKTKMNLNESELLMILNHMKGKDNVRTYKKKTLNISLNDNLSQNHFLKHIKFMKNMNNNNIRLNRHYTNITNNSSIYNNKYNDKVKKTQIFNNYYSINNIGNSQIPVRVINVYNGI